LKNLLTYNAAQAALLRCILLREDAAEAAEYVYVHGSQHHDTLVLGWDGQVGKGQARQVPPVLLAAVPGQAHREGGKDIIPTAVLDHGDPVMLVPNIAQRVGLSLFPPLLWTRPDLARWCLIRQVFLLEQNKKRKSALPRKRVTA
jgi:hypothetical protein